MRCTLGPSEAARMVLCAVRKPTRGFDIQFRGLYRILLFVSSVKDHLSDEEK